MRGKLIASITMTVAALVGCGSQQTSSAPETTTTTTDDIPRISPIPIPVRSSATVAPGATAPAATSCDEPPARLVDMMNGAFTDGQHLEDVQALDGPRASTYIAGNIYTADGVKDSSHNAWVYMNGQIYAVTKDARRDTLFTDGRDLVPADFFSSNDWETLGECINAAARAAGK